jgi:hypothetical protein
VCVCIGVCGGVMYCMYVHIRTLLSFIRTHTHTHTLLHLLLQGQAKMSKSDPDSAIFMEDEVCMRVCMSSHCEDFCLIRIHTHYFDLSHILFHTRITHMLKYSAHTHTHSLSLSHTHTLSLSHTHTHTHTHTETRREEENQVGLLPRG